MAAAILMMNMHGAVCASDRDRTVFRYSEKIPFAVMVDPKSELPWENIMMAYQAKKSVSTEKTLEENANDFRLYLTDVLNQEDESTLDKEIDKKVICVGYDPDNMFPRVSVMRISRYKNGIIVFRNNNKTSEKHSEFHINLGDCPNIQILFGGMSEDILEKMKEYFCNKLGEIMGNQEAAIGLINNFRTEYIEAFNKMQNDPLVTSSISDFTIKDMVAMAENLIETENLQSGDNPVISPAREIGILTLAEGFVWIKHSLYSA